MLELHAEDGSLDFVEPRIEAVQVVIIAPLDAVDAEHLELLGERIVLRDDHPAIAEVAAFGVPHRTLGDDVMAAVVLRAGQALRADEARDWVAARLAHFKVPGRIVFLDALPRTPVGKVDRPALVALAAHGTAATAAAAPEGAGDDDLAAYVARLWAHELELAQVGPDEDFSALGGDSLSALRIQLALEAAFGLRITPAEARSLRTVSATASFLAWRGAKPPRLNAASPWS